MKKPLIVIGAGINGLVCAFYLRRAGHEVVLLEKKAEVGGACTFEKFTHRGKEFSYPTGASVFGMMQDFVFRETGLDKKLDVIFPEDRAMVFFGEEKEGLRISESPDAFAREAQDSWGEQGNIVEWSKELGEVTKFLIDGFRGGLSPRRHLAKEQLGEMVYQRWFEGSALNLFQHFFTSDRMKIYKSMGINESGPVPFDAPGSAFNIALMSTGTVADGEWGFVKGGLYRLPLALAGILESQGVEILRSADITSLDAVKKKVVVGTREIEGQAIFLATDPLTAADLTGNTELKKTVRQKTYLGSSGKLVLFFEEPVRWKHGTTDFRFIYPMDRFDQFVDSNTAMRERRLDFSPACFQVYCEGQAMRKMGWNEPYDYLSVFTKDVGFGKKGSEMATAHETVKRGVLSRIENPKACFWSVFLSPADLKEKFYFPEGNIDHMELRQGQNFSERSFSTSPSHFYQWGGFENVFYCGAGSYPCGSVAGTPGYLAATEFLRG